jgi:AcrR family transcriptional regulator
VRTKDDNKVAKIFDATLQLVEYHGLTGINMSDIAKASGLAIGTLYIYFKNKEELINELFTVCRKESAALYFKDLKKEDDFKDSFHKVFMNILQYRIHHFRESIFMEQCFHSSYFGVEKRKENFQFMKPLFTILNKGKKQKIIKDYDNQFLLWFLIGNISEVVKGMVYGKKTLTEDMINRLFQMCWDAIKKND